LRFYVIFLAGGLLAGVAALVVFFFGIYGGTPAADAELTLSISSPRIEKVSKAGSDETVRLAVAAVLSPTEAQHQYVALGEYLEKELNRPVVIIHGKTYAETNELVRTGGATLALVCSGAFVEGERDFGMEAIAVPVVNGKTTYRSFLIVPASDPATSWEEVRDYSFAFTDPMSNSGRLVPVYMLSTMDESPESFFKDFVFTYSHDKSIRAVAEGLVGAASVDSLVYEAMVKDDPSIAERTRIVWKSPEYGINPLVVHPEIEAALKIALERAFLNMDAGYEGQVVLDHLGIDSFESPSETDYSEIALMIDATAGR